MKVIIDCDPGVDDAVALMIAMSLFDSSVEVMAVTVVDGNVGVMDGTLNAAVVLNWCGQFDIPIYTGCHTSLLPTNVCFRSSKVHGGQGLGNFTYPSFDTSHYGVSHDPKKPAAVALVEAVNANKGQITLIALGPLTNIAMAVRLDDKFLEKLSGLYIMGGDYGDLKRSPEFNFFMDPEAAHIVLSHGSAKRCPTVIVPYDVCYFSTPNTSFEWLDSILNAEESDFRTFFATISQPFRSYYKAQGFSCCDAIAMLCALDFNNFVTDFDEVSTCSILLKSINSESDYDRPLRPGNGFRGCLVAAKATSGKPSMSRIVTKIDEKLYQKAIADLISRMSTKKLSVTAC